jgi:hypothetical protein
MAPSLGLKFIFTVGFGLAGGADGEGDRELWAVEVVTNGFLCLSGGV